MSLGKQMLNVAPVDKGKINYRKKNVICREFYISTKHKRAQLTNPLFILE